MRNFEVWSLISRIIIKRRFFVLFAVVGATVLLSTQWKYNHFSFSEVTLLPEDHPISVTYQKFKQTFGDEGNLIVIGIEDSVLSQPKVLKAWNNLNKKLISAKEFSLVVTSSNLKKLVKNNAKQRLEIEEICISDTTETKTLASLYDQLPFYEGILFNENKTAVRSLAFIDEEILNTDVRKGFILGTFSQWIDEFRQQTQADIKVSGMPYIRTKNAQNIVSEIELFISLALIITSLIFFFFFRSFRATFISMVIVAIGVMWAFGILGFFRFQMTVLTALIPPLIIVIGIPNCIFLINKYQQEIKKHGNQAKSLHRVITKVGNATLLTNLTTAAGFATFVFTDSNLLQDFGVVASISIMSLFLLSLLIIPSVYSFLSIPKKRHLRHLSRNWIVLLVSKMEYVVRHQRITVYIVTLLLLVISIVGFYKVKTSASLLDDISKDSKFAKDVLFFEKEFGGVMPLEITVDTKKRNGVLRLTNLERIEKLQNRMKDVFKLPQPISVVGMSKFLKQTYYNGNPDYYMLPTRQEGTFILSYSKNMNEEDTGLLKNFSDSLGQTARITTYLTNDDVNRLDEIEQDIQTEVQQLFPKKRYDVTVTGRSWSFFQGTRFLIKNLFVSLTLAIILISVLIAYMFRSFKMVVISLIPNLLPLLVTAGIMGFMEIPLKPSTILVFGIAFGISVDDTLHFLAKYRQELKQNNWKISKSVFAALRETGVSMFYTSIVLYFGFSIFMLSSFGGTKALGGLVSTTLLLAMLSNLVLLPSLLLSLERIVANKTTLKKPSINILSEIEDH